MSPTVTDALPAPRRVRAEPTPTLPRLLPREAGERLARLAAAALRAPVALTAVRDDGRWILAAGIGLQADGFVIGGAPPPWLTLPPGADQGVVMAAHTRPTPRFGAVALSSPSGDLVGALFALEPSHRSLTDDDLTALADAAGVGTTEIALRHDLAERECVEQQLRHDSLHDALTSLPNRTLFLERLGHALARARRRPDYLFAVLFLDLDRFKVVNDSLGHQVGDELLVAVARRLEACLRTEDTVARLGGDEFAILLEDISGISDAGRIAERIQQRLSGPVNLSGYEVFTSASIGIVDSSAAHGASDHLLRSADMAMYRAKAAGKARYEMFDRAMHAQALARLQLETDLRHGFERGEFRIYYQPIVSLETGRIVAVEALLRWAQFERGIVSPADFIPLAEEMGLILQLGRWVLEEACAQVQSWRRDIPEAPPLALAVNLSARQFSQSDLVGQVATALAGSGFPANSLTLEITESVVVENPDNAANVLRGLKRLGVEVHMDDFGTGYSSLSYLTRLPIDAIKIDRAFVGRMESEDTHFQLVRTILTLARAMNLRAVAEGVETVAQLVALRKLGCEHAQGYLFSTPLPASELELLLRKNPRW
ncbi:MAG: EAL domain-containing protein [Gemmatimonadota bacterium]|nr:EAL domain-containing protein [Gemmatimonadota bacterium]